jgi:antitoxin VapB
MLFIISPEGARAVRRAAAGAARRVDRQAGCVIYIIGRYHYLIGCGMTATAKLFMHGRSQAVRLPKEFRFEGTEVRVSKVGDKVILEPLKKQPFDAEAWFARLDELGGRDFLPDGIPDDPPVEPDPRVFFDE